MIFHFQTIVYSSLQVVPDSPARICASVPESIEQPVDYTLTNIVGTVNMMEAAAKNGVKKFTYASSAAVYGDDETMPKQEEIVGNRLSTYAVTKFVAEEYAYQYTMHYGLDCYGMRYFNVYGRQQDPNGAYAAVIPKFIECLLRDEPRDDQWRWRAVA